MTRPLLLGDIGGTFARFVLAGAAGPLPSATILKTGTYPTLAGAVAAFLAEHGTPALGGAALSAAGPVTNGVVALTNQFWAVSVDELARATGVSDPVLVNDFTAAAMGVLMLRPEQRVQLGPCSEGLAGTPIAVLGPGTGLGVSGLIPDERGVYTPLAGEGGHVDLAATTPREQAVLEHCLNGHDHVSAERVLSGRGLEQLYRALAAIDGGAPRASWPDAAAIAELARAGKDPVAGESITLFTGWLGAFAGNLALTLGARSGVFIAGGVLPRWGALFDAAVFRQRFEAKGRFAGYLASIPTFLVTAPDLALEGLRTLLRQRDVL